MDRDNSKTILLVEDDATSVIYEKKILEKHGFNVITAANGETAIETIDNTPGINLILMDVILGPGMNGPEAAKQILKKHDIPLIFLSHHTESQMVRKTEGITSYGYIVKNSGDMALIASIKMAFELYESNRLLSDTFKYSINGLCIHKMLYDEKGNPFDCEYLKVNKAYETHTGLASHLVIGQTIRDIYPDGEADEVINLYIDALSTGEAIQKEIYFVPTQRWFELSIFPTKKDEFTIAIQNITDRKQAEEALRESKALYASLVNSLPQNLYRIDLDGRITFVNRSLIESMGVPETELLGKTAYDFPPPDLAQKYRRDDQEIIVSGQPLRLIEENIDPATGKRIFVDVLKIPIFADDGRIVGIQGVFEDVTDRKQAEMALQKSEEKYRTLFERVADAIFMYDPDTFEILEANEATSKRYGYDHAELIGMSCLKFSAEVDESQGLAKRMLKEGQAGTPIRHHKKKDGSDLYAQLTGYKTNIDGRDVVFAVCTDITERIQAEIKLRELTQELDQRVIRRTADLEMKRLELESFAYMVSHDLKAPLRGIAGYARLLKQDYASNLDGDGLFFLNNIQQATQIMNQLIEDLLVYSRLDKLSAGSININLMVDAVKREKEREDDYSETRWHIDLPPMVVFGEPEGLKMALRNLVENAVKFTRDVAEPTIWIGGVEYEKNHTLWVRDNGIGFDMQFHDRVFKIFQRLHHEEYSGTGIGLALVMKAMARINGRAWAESVPGQGTTFYLEIPKRTDWDTPLPST